MKRPRRRPERPPLDQRRLEGLAQRATYEGSPEHKTTEWWGGLPSAFEDSDGRVRRRNPRAQLTTPCHLTTADDRQRATEWVRAAIAQGNCRFVVDCGDFPRHIWYRDDDGGCWQGRCINVDLGTYKGWPISEDEFREMAS